MTAPGVIRSAAAYRAIPDLDDRQARVLVAIRNHPGSTSREIARLARMEPYNARSRITELLDDRKIVCTGERVDELTHRTVRTYEVRA